MGGHSTPDIVRSRQATEFRFFAIIRSKLDDQVDPDIFETSRCVRLIVTGILCCTPNSDFQRAAVRKSVIKIVFRGMFEADAMCALLELESSSSLPSSFLRTVSRQEDVN